MKLTDYRSETVFCMWGVVMFRGYKIIAFCVPIAYDNICCNIISAMNDAAVDKNYRIFIYHTCSDLYWGTKNEDCDKAVFRLMDFSIIDTVVIFDEKFYDKSAVGDICEAAKKNNVPVILIGAKREGCISVFFDYESGFEEVVRHVVEYHGISDIFLIAGGKDSDTSNRRVDIFKKVYAENGYTFRDDMMGYGDYWWGPTLEIMNRLYEENRIPKAFVCINDSMAVTVCSFLQEKGYNVPDDVVITGFDGINEALFCIPPITTSCMKNEELADTIIGIADDIFSHNEVKDRYVIKYSLDIYESCGCKNPRKLINTGKLLKDTDERFKMYQEHDLVFHSISEKIMNCSSTEEIIENFERADFAETSIVINSSCFDESINPCDDVPGNNPFDEYILLLYQKAEKEDSPLNLPVQFEKKNVLPNIDYMLSKRNPLLFNTLGFMGVPYGYVCFSYYPCQDSYSKIPQIISFINYAIGGYRNVKYAKYVAKNLEEIADHDFMTGLYNRSGFYKQIDRIKYADNVRYMIVAMVDLDGLKMINDTYGHDSGDFAINSISRALNFISLNNKICGRFGGDEFVLCASVVNCEAAEELIRCEITKYLNRINDLGDKPFKLSASIGTVSAPIETSDFDELMKIADDRMYAEKITRPNHRVRRSNE